MGATAIRWVKGRDAANLSTGHRRATTTKNYLVPNAKSAEAEKPQWTPFTWIPLLESGSSVSLTIGLMPWPCLAPSPLSMWMKIPLPEATK